MLLVYCSVISESSIFSRIANNLFGRDVIIHDCETNHEQICPAGDLLMIVHGSSSIDKRPLEEAMAKCDPSHFLQICTM